MVAGLVEAEEQLAVGVRFFSSVDSACELIKDVVAAVQYPPLFLPGCNSTRTPKSFARRAGTRSATGSFESPLSD
jgi:hypothetical protein